VTNPTRYYFPTHLGQKLVDDGIANTGTRVCAASLFTDGIDFIENNDMQSRLVALFLLLYVTKSSFSQKHGPSDRETAPTSFSASANNFLIFSSL
jgi:hypothetical protein